LSDYKHLFVQGIKNHQPCPKNASGGPLEAYKQALYIRQPARAPSLAVLKNIRSPNDAAVLINRARYSALAYYSRLQVESRLYIKSLIRTPLGFSIHQAEMAVSGGDERLGGIASASVRTTSLIFPPAASAVPPQPGRSIARGHSQKTALGRFSERSNPPSPVTA